MSDTQSSITDRFSNKANRSSSILSKDHPPDKKPNRDKPAVSSSHEFDPTDVLVQKSDCVLVEGKPESCGLVQRCVIIQKDENGFGLTVSGDNPVFVQLVKEDGAAERAGVQTGDRIIKVNGTLVTHSNHVEVVKLIKSGSYVALTVLGRPPGLPQIPLSECEAKLGFPGPQAGSSPVSSPNATGQPTGERPYSPHDRITSPLPIWEENNSVHSQKVDILQKMLSKEQQDLQAMKEEYSRNPMPKLLKDIQEAKKHIPQLQWQLSKATGGAQDALQLGDGDDGSMVDMDHTPSSRGDSSNDLSWSSSTMSPVLRSFAPASPESLCQRDMLSYHSPKSTPRDSFNSCHSPDPEDTPDLDSLSPSAVNSPSSRFVSQIIGAEDDYFDSDQEQVNGQCSCFQSMELLKSRPAHLAAFLHHVVSQFDPAPLLCYLFADLCKQTNSKETRRVFMDFHSFFIDRGANLKVAVPESISSDLDRRRTELIPEEQNRQLVQMMQDTLLPDIQRNLEDFRQKRSMGLTLAEGELARLDTERVRDRVALERERSCAENIITKIEDVLLTTQSTEEEKCTTMQYVILAYMKRLGVKVKEPRGLEFKRVRLNFLPKIKKSVKTEKEGGEEKVKRTRFPSILGPPRRPSRVDPTSIGKAMDLNKPRPQKQLSQPCLGAVEHLEAGRLTASQSSEGSELTHSSNTNATSPTNNTTNSHASDGGSRDSEFVLTPNSAFLKLSEGLGDLDSLQYTPNTHFDYSLSPYSLDQLQEEDRESRILEGTPKSIRRLDGLGPTEVQSEDDQGGTDSEHDPLNWQQLVGREILAGLGAHEIKRQEVINELFYTERAHLRMLKVLDNIFYQKLTREAILPPADIKNIFTNLGDIVQLHVLISEQMATIRKRNETSVIDQIGDDLLSWFSGGEEEKIKQAVGTFCSNQPFALELIKSRQKKDSRFTSFMQEAESNRLCRRLQLKDIIPVEMQRLTKYPLLLENIAKYTDDTMEKDKVKKAGDCCRKILNHVNQAVKESENKQRLEDYQRRLDLSSLKQTENPMITELKNLDLTKKKMIHEGPLSWKVNKDKTIELYTLLLEDILVLLQKQDERLVLKCHSKNLSGTADTKHIFSPIIKLNAVLVRSVATDNKSFFVLSMSDNGAQIYELMAQTVSEQRMWQRQITQRADAMKVKPHSGIHLPQTDVEIIAADVARLGKDPDRISSGSSQSIDKECSSASGGVMQTSPPDAKSFVGLKPEEEEPSREEGLYGDPDLADRLPFRMAVDGFSESDGLGFSPSRADDALKTLSALKQVLVTQLMSQEDGERAGRSSSGGGRLLRTTSLRTPVDSRARVAVQKGSGMCTQASHPEDPAQDLVSGDTGFFESPEDYAGYLVLEGYGGSGESSTDDDLQATGKQLSASRGCGAGDSGISLRFSSASQAGSISSFSRQVLSHLRNLQTNLNHLKEVEAKYHSLLRQRPARSSTGTDINKDKR
ncbi:rho guanine nucleotide exchange factor 12 isoform X1 [Oncorhynchus kisutch]|uniref:rho guanine nucleotide exchange factor 12 isoform X1 n=1 Tax=Oncorhynchus kisutch TaxID=8019 RepID=UPI0009A04C47|nr:rho guanine nucleotide exchange factor 12 isoform X1 [Oncorhynchus kisutch]XP_020358308.1 rho guanine nucleotide exchange factor 12 isoform X1 [Oncorhynchus kisutch]XP_020358309.1 rho guanine nucleotide exchange factor 12 isoform X1 [Oncorhynchus kisutch]XP_031646291.1 rho guanine nucleotide exchange factor 12 isoform X1 [Oncorhynchus kisutch]